MRLVAILSSLFVCAFSAAVEEEYVEEEDTTEATPIPSFAGLLSELNHIDVEITKILVSMSPDESDGDKLVSNLQGYIHTIGPLIHNIATDDTEVLMVAKSVYRQGSPKFLSIPVQSEVVQRAFKWDENQMTLVHTLYRIAGKSWRNFLNMCERHRIEG